MQKYIIPIYLFLRESISTKYLLRLSLDNFISSTLIIYPARTSAILKLFINHSTSQAEKVLDFLSFSLLLESQYCIASYFSSNFSLFFISPKPLFEYNWGLLLLTNSSNSSYSYSSLLFSSSSISSYSFLLFKGLLFSIESKIISLLELSSINLYLSIVIFLS